ncbi:MAG: hypothetical protein P1V97_37680, partial [Planctomycetota bacterium]|nr:hypothetical protein [Planctomycetota bacterium]
AKMSFYFGRVNGDILFTTHKATIEGLIDGKPGPGASKNLTAALAKTPKDAQFSMYFSYKAYENLFETMKEEIPARDREQFEGIMKMSTGMVEYFALAAKVDKDYKDYEIYSYQKTSEKMGKELSAVYGAADPHPGVWTHMPKESFAAFNAEIQPLKAFDSVLKLFMPLIIPNLMDARSSGNEAAAIGAMRTLSSAQAIYLESDKDGNGKLDYGTLKALGKAGFIDTVLASGTKQGYKFTCQPDAKSPEYQWYATATPINENTGSRCFFTDQTGVIRWAETPLNAITGPKASVVGAGGPRKTKRKKLTEAEIKKKIDEGIAGFNKEVLLGYRLKEDILANLGVSHGASIITQEKLVPTGVPVAAQERMVAVPAAVVLLQVTKSKILEEMLIKFNQKYLVESGNSRPEYEPRENKVTNAFYPITSAQRSYLRRTKNKSYGTIAQLVEMKLLDKSYGIPKDGYKFEIRVDPKAPAMKYMVKATPIDGYGFHFASDQGGRAKMVRETFKWEQKELDESPNIYSRLPKGFVVKRRKTGKEVPIGFVKTGNYYKLNFPKREEKNMVQTFGNGFRPCYAFHNGYFIFATSEAAMKKAMAAKSGSSVMESESFTRLMKGQPRKVNSSLYFSFDGVIDQIKANSKMIALEAFPVPSEVTAEKKSPSAGNKLAAIGAMKTFNTAQAIYRERNQDQKYGTLKELVSSQMIDNVLGSGEKNGYKFIVQPGPNSKYEYWVAADPIAKGGKYLFTNQNGVIYQSDKAIRPRNKKSSSPPYDVRPMGSGGGDDYWAKRQAKRKKQREWRKENIDANNKKLLEILDSSRFLGGMVSTATLKGSEAETRFLYRLKMD